MVQKRQEVFKINSMRFTFEQLYHEDELQGYTGQRKVDL